MFHALLCYFIKTEELTMKLLTFFTLLSTALIFGADAAEQSVAAEQAPGTKYIRTLIVKLPSKFPDAEINLTIPGEKEPQVFRNVKHDDILTLEPPLSISLDGYKNYTSYPRFGMTILEHKEFFPQPIIHGVMKADPAEPGSCYLEGVLFHKDNYIKNGNDVFDDVPLAKDTTSTMKLMISDRKGLIKAYRIFPRTL